MNDDSDGGAAAPPLRLRAGARNTSIGMISALSSHGGVILAGSTNGSLAVWSWDAELLWVQFSASASLSKPPEHGTDSLDGAHGIEPIRCEVIIEKTRLGERPRFAHTSEVTAFFVAMCQDGNLQSRDACAEDGVNGKFYAISGSEDGRIHVWPWDDELNLFAHDPSDPLLRVEPVTSFAHSSERHVSITAVAATRQFIVTGGHTGDIQVHSWKGTDVCSFSGKESSAWVRGINFEPSGRFLVACDDNGWLSFYEWNSGKNLPSGRQEAVKRVRPHKDYVRAISSSEDLICSVSDDRVVCLSTWEGKQQRQLKMHTNWVTATSYSESLGQFATSGRDASIFVFDSEGNERYAVIGRPGEVDSAADVSLDTPIATIYGLAFHPTDDLLASGGRDSVLRVWGGEVMVKSARHV